MSQFFVEPEDITGLGSNPIGAAGGDLTGSYPNPNVAKINSATVPNAGSLTTGNLLQVTGASTLSYAALNLAGGSGFVTGTLPAANQAAQTLAGDLSGTTTASVVDKINGATVPASGALTIGNSLQVSGASAVSYAALDLAGGSNYVTGLLPIANQAAQNLGGDLSGTTASATVEKLNGALTVPAGALITGNVLQINGTSSTTYGPLNLAGGANYVTGALPIINQVAQALSGDLSGTTATATVTKINGSTIPAGGSLTTGHVLQVSGSSAVSYAALDLAGGSNYVTGALPTANQVAQSLSGDLSGTTASATVLKINGTSVAATPSANQILVASSGTASSWTLLTDANIASGAGIAATKIAYSDGVSPVLSATTVQGAIDAIKTATVATSIQRLSQTITTANLQALGAIGTGSLNIGSTLPTNARVLGAEINVTQALAALGLSVAVATVQGSTDVAGSLIAAATVLTTGFIGGTGTNQYLTRSGQQLTTTVVLTGALFSALTAGNLVINIFYAVVP